MPSLSNEEGSRGSSAPGASWPIDLEIRVILDSSSGSTQLRYILHSPSARVEYIFHEIQGNILRGEPGAYRQRLLERIEKLIGGKDVDGMEISARDMTGQLEGMGHELFHELFSPEMRYEYQRFRKAVRTLVIVSDEPWIPWELLKPFDPELGIDDDFLCLQFEMTRWLSGSRAAALQIPVQGLAAIEASNVEGFQKLPYALREKELLAELANSKPGMQDLSPSSGSYEQVTQLLGSGGKQLFHFVAHGDFKSVRPNESSLLLSDGRRLRAFDLHGAIQNRLQRDRPLVFLNACRVGSQSWSLTGLDGWAERWVRRCGCGAFIGPLWSVSDRLAYAFAKSLYSALQKGETFGSAARQARHLVRNLAPSNPAWLAYSVYAHPNGGLILGGRGLEKSSEAAGEDSGQIPRSGRGAPLTESLEDASAAPPLVEPPSLRERLQGHLAFAWRKPLAAFPLAFLFLLATAAALLLLGWQTHREREFLLRMQDPLSYPVGQLLLAGADSIVSLPWKAVGAVFLGNSVIVSSLLALLAICIASIWLARRPRPSALYLLGMLGVTTTLAVGSLVYVLALQATDFTGKAPLALSGCPPLGRSLSSQISFETCFWLRNDSELNNGLREILNGLILWLLAAIGLSAWAGIRIRPPARLLSHLKRGVVVLLALLFLYVTYWIPLAHAYGKWGIRYPVVSALSGGCHETLPSQLSRGECLAFDVSAGAAQQKLYLGQGCTPEGLWSPPPDRVCQLQFTGFKKVVVGQGQLMLVLDELQRLNLIGKLREADQYLAGGNPSGRESALEIYREVLKKLSPQARRSLKQLLLAGADQDYRNGHYDAAAAKYRSLFSKFL